MAEGRGLVALVRGGSLAVAWAEEVTRMQTSAHHSELDRGACLMLLAGGGVGRVVFTEAAMPAVAPVVYHMDDEEVVFRTAVGSTLAAATWARVIAFQADCIDLRTHTGWTVLGVGQTHEVVDGVRLAALGRRLPAALVPVHTIALRLERLSGLRLAGRSG
ncbi:MAG: pyridoxamine 5'-phosphate oxidase family protein [Pseudonocardia sp.]|uniref:pyridoxamine 5'-phosphate oxidase family protein n=2 Tax=Pseudonocardia TaxID=1847 RepID=UPI001AD4F933|nr:pyridoxamine 5'-phosphate oxidase family protein [Pseudonocardia sp.]MBN9096924.1 pyridoxamine 5'-phosphate oxidase family protein [Pseudonocardia sp.]